MCAKLPSFLDLVFLGFKEVGGKLAQGTALRLGAAGAHQELDAYLKDTLTYFARRYYGRDQAAQIVVGKGR